MTPFKVKEKNDSVKSYYHYQVGDKSELEVEIYYSLGGMNYFTGNVNPRGYYLSVTPVTFEDRGGFTSISCTLLGTYSGIKTLIEPATRFNKKTFDRVVSENKDNEKLVLELVDAILVKAMA